MARYDLGGPNEFTRHQPPLPDVDPDLAGEIGSEIVLPRPVWATQCIFDDEGDLIYGEEVALQRRDGRSVALEIPCRGRCVDMPAHILRVEDNKWRLATVFVCEWPYILNVRGQGRLRSVSKKRRPEDFFLQATTRLEDGAQLIEATDDFDFDPFRTDGSGVLAYLRYDKTHGDLFSGRTSDAEQRKLGKKREDRSAEPPLSDQLSPSVLLWGICHHDDLTRAKEWLRNHADLQDVVLDAKAGLIRNAVLYSQERKSLAKRQVAGIAVPDVAQRQVDRVLDACIHLALCGTVEPSEFRGYAPARQGQTPEQKQTVATHLRRLFIDTLRLYSLRCTEPEIQAQLMAETNHWPQPATKELNPVATKPGNSAKDLDERLGALLDQLESVNPLAIPWESDLERAIRSGDSEEVEGSLVLAVAFFQTTGTLPKKVGALIRHLARSKEPTVAQVAGWADDRLRPS